MNRLSCNEMTTYRWSFEEDVEHYRRAGISGIGVWRQKLSDFGEERGIELLQDSGLRVSNLLWAGGFTGSDGRSYREAVEDGREAILLAAALKADCLVAHTGPRAGHTNNHARRLIQGALAELLPLAAEHDVVLALEPMHAAYAGDWTFLTELDEAAEFVSCHDSPYLRLVFDTYHFGHDPALVCRLPELVPLLAIVHLGDGRRGEGPEQDRTRLGDGQVLLPQIVQALEAAGYEGFYDLELIGPEIETCDYNELLAHSRRYFAQLPGRISV
jgi:sugar phosphate isomerase/epimerase